MSTQPPWSMPEQLYTVLDAALAALERADIPHVVGGGIAAIAYGLREITHDIDIFVQPEIAPRARAALRQAGFHVWTEDPAWLDKALRQGVEVDLIHESTGPVYVGRETIERAVETVIRGRRLRVLPPEDFFLMKAMAATPGAPVHLFDAIAILKQTAIDWPYLCRLIPPGRRKVLRAFVAASDEGVDVPSFVLIRALRPLLD